MSNMEELEKRDQQHVVRAWTTVAEPTIVVKAQGCVLTDVAGREYIDMTSGLFTANVGHCHPEVVAAICDQASQVIQISALQSSLPEIALAEKLAQIVPGELHRAYFTSGGAETVDAALKMARQHTGKQEVIALRHAYHGMTGGAQTVTDTAGYRANFGPLPSGVLRAPSPYCYRCPFDLSYPACDLRCADEIERIIHNTSIITASVWGDIGTMILEPIQGRGAIIPPPGWMSKVREICTRHGLLLLADEIQTGFGRTGRMFCVDHENVVPDILVLGKNVGGAIPCGAVMTTEGISRTFKAGVGPTFGAHALACRAGLVTIQIIERDRLAENATAMGQRMKEGLENMSTRRFVGQARFKGLMGALELVLDLKTKEPVAKKDINSIKEEVYKRGIIVTTSGPLGNAFRMQPPLVVTPQQLDQIVAAFDGALAAVLG
jgi:4-aminobutyrate aminotransferase-like enzyme